jgi:hypothetical protein
MPGEVPRDLGSRGELQFPPQMLRSGEQNGIHGMDSCSAALTWAAHVIAWSDAAISEAASTNPGIYRYVAPQDIPMFQM